MPASQAEVVWQAPQHKLDLLKQRREQLRTAKRERHRRYVNDPVGWVQDMAGGFVWSRPRSILEAIRDNRLVAVRSCHGIGKSWTVARAVAWWVAIHDPSEVRVVTTAPTGDQVRAVLWQEIRAAAGKAGLPKPQQTQWMIDNILVAIGRKPDDYKPDALQGIHAKHLMVVLDEANGVSPALWKAALSLCTSKDSRLVAIGNPDDPTSQFAQVCRPASGWARIQIGYLDTPNYTGETVPDELRELLIGDNFLEDARKLYGEGSPMWISKVLGEFPEQAEDALITLKSAYAAAQRDLPEGDFPNALGVDVARFGSDKTVIYHRVGKRFRVHKVIPYGDTMDTAGHVVIALRETGAQVAAIDCDGIGGGVYDRLVELGHPVQELHGGEKARDSERFYNRRAEWYWGLRQRFEDGDIDLDPDDEETLAQVTAIKWRPNSRGQIQLETKEEMKKRGMPSPDQADALAYVNAAWDIPWGDVYGPGEKPAPGEEKKPEPPNPWAMAYGSGK